MSNVWHTPIFIPDPFRAYPIVVIYEAGDEIEQMMSNEYRTRVGDRYVNRWCYVNDLLNCEKALDVAVDALKDNLSQANFREMLDASRFHCIRTKCELALEQITKLEQKENQ